MPKSSVAWNSQLLLLRHNDKEFAPVWETGGSLVLIHANVVYRSRRKTTAKLLHQPSNIVLDAGNAHAQNHSQKTKLTGHV